MITAVSIDDEPHAHDVIAHYASKMDILDLQDSFTSPLKAAEYLKKHPVDLIFLDINMPDLDGISLLKMLKDPPTVIFTTAYDEYAVESYDHEAAGYLLKPIEFPKFYKSVMRVVELKKPAANQASVNLAPLTSSLLLKSGNKMLKIEAKSIQYVEASGNYATLYMEKRSQLVDHTLSDLMENHLKPPFMRIHRSYIVNMQYLEEYESHQLRVAGQQLSVGKTYRKEIRSYIDSFS